MGEQVPGRTLVPQGAAVQVRRLLVCVENCQLACCLLHVLGHGVLAASKNRVSFFLGSRSTAAAPTSISFWRSQPDRVRSCVCAACRLATSAWMAGLTPGSVIRGLGPWGPGLIDKYVNGRFSVHGETAWGSVLNTPTQACKACKACGKMATAASRAQRVRGSKVCSCGSAACL